MSTPRRISALVVAALALAGCGDKLPESETARKIGEQPKQTVDKAAADVNKALQQGADRMREADKKN